jgi:carboxyl-terminal processing protease
MSMGIAGFFVSEHGQRLGTLRSRDLKYDFEIAPRALTFDGPLAILVDGGSASTSEIFAGGLRDIHRARIFGTKTAAAALPSVIMKLPNGDGFQYANANYVSRGGMTLEGNGITPDEIVPQSRAALLRGHDAVVDAAVEWISKQK